jgi:hypothetical protein
MIECKICNTQFEKIIPWQHLKIHNISTAEYKQQFGEVYSEETKQKHSQRVPYNKGIAMSSEQKDVLRKKALERNAIWRENDSNPNTGSKRTEQTKQKLKAARAKQVITPEQVQKALETKRRNGYDLAIFRGKKHTESAKAKMKAAAVFANQKKTAAAHLRINQLLVNYNFTLLNSLYDTTLDLQCNVCNSTFSFTKQYFSQSKTHDQLCPTCYPRNITDSKPEKEILEYIKSLNLNTTIIENYRKTYHSKEIDIYLPDLKIGFEYHGLYFHSELFKTSTYHKEKYDAAANNGIRLIQIFSDEWHNQSDIVKSRINALLNASETTVFARKCTIKIIKHEATEFLNKHHIQGCGRSNIKLGLYYNQQLVAVMTFLHGDISKRILDWELNRFCSLSNYNVVGAASKLFKYFVKNYNPNLVISFADLRWSSTSAVYEKLGFTLDHISPPNYWYIKPNEHKRIHRYALRKPARCVITEKELRSQEGWLRIWDCGSAKFVWSKESPI